MPAVAPLVRRKRTIPELAVVHAEELAYLWQRRRLAVRSTSLTISGFAELNDRIEAHLQGLLIHGDELPAVLDGRLSADDRDEVFAQFWPLLRTHSPVFARRVLESFAQASGCRLAGITDALAMSSPLHTEATLRAALKHGSAAHAAAAAVVLASQRRLDPRDERLAKLLDDAEPWVSTQAWRAVMQVDDAAQPIPRPYSSAIAHSDAGLRAAALEAGVWRAEPWCGAVIRKLATAGDILGLEWLAATVTDAAEPALDALLNADEPKRCELLGRSGQVTSFERLLALMDSADAVVSAAAGEAWTRLNGLDVEGRRTTHPVADDASEVEREFAADLTLPDVTRARQQWVEHRDRWLQGSHWCRGHDIGNALSSAAQRSIDLQARWDFGARAALAGSRLIPPPPAI